MPSCRDCGKEFTFEEWENLPAEEMEDVEGKILVCDECGGDVTQEITTDSKSECKICSKRIKHLEKHKKRNHNKCEACENYYDEEYQDLEAQERESNNWELTETLCPHCGATVEVERID